MPFFEDLIVGHKDRFGAYEVTREAALAFAQAYDPQPFHLSDEGAEGTPFKGMSISGFQTGAIVMRMMVDRWAGSPGNLGGIGMDELRWLKPVYPGDVLSLETEVLEMIPSRSKPDRGVTKQRWTAFNQHGEPVITMIAIGMQKRRG